MSLIPPGPPVEIPVDDRTVLARKGSLRRAETARPLARSAPFCQDEIATGGSGGMS
jgi:hypothetical protein